MVPIRRYRGRRNTYTGELGDQLLAKLDEALACTCSTWWVDPDSGREYDQGGGDRVRMRSSEPDPECPVHGS